MRCNQCYPDPCNCQPEPACLPCSGSDDGCDKGLTNLKCTRYSDDDLVCDDLTITRADSGDEVTKKLFNAICELSSNSNDKFVRITQNDSTSGYLSNKLTTSKYISYNVVNPTLNEQLRINVNYDLLVSDIISGLQFPEDKFVKVSVDDTTRGFLASKLVQGSGITITKLNSSANETLSIAAKISPTGSNALINDGNGLYVPVPTPFVETVLAATDSSTVDFTTTGTSKHTLTADVRFSNNPLNVATDNGGVFVGATDTDTIDFSVIGVGADKRLKADVKLSANAGNQLTNTSGLYVSDITANNGLTYLNKNVKLGGALIESTILTGAQPVALPSGRLIIGGFDSASSANTKLFINDTSNNQFSTIISKESNTYTGGVTPFLSSIGLNGSGTLGLGTSFSSISSQIVFYNASTLNLYSDLNTEYTATTSIVKFIDDAHSVTGNILSSYHSGMAVAGAANIAAYAGIKIAPVQQVASTSDNIQDAYTGTISNYYGIHINNLRSTSLQSRISNTYGIYQIGAGDRNYFAGNVGIKTSPSTSLSLNVYGSSVYQANNNISTNGIGTSTAWVIGQLDGAAVNQSGSAISASEINTIYLNGTANATLNFLSPIGANVSNVIKNGSGNYTGAVIASYTSIATLRAEGNIEKLAGLHVIPPRQEQLVPLTAYTGNISMFAGIYLEDASNSDIASSITNKYGIYQIGATDRNYFAGPIEAGNSAKYWLAPVRATGNRPASPQNGMFGYNSSTNKFEGYANGTWVDFH